MGIGHSSGARALAGHAGATLARGDWRSTLARSGLIAKGVLYAALGLLAIQVARGQAASRTASREGAIELVASQPMGQWLLVLFTIGLFALATWHVVLAFTGDPVEGSEPLDRAKYAGKAAIYAATAVTALTILMARMGNAAAGRAGRGGESEDQAASMIMGWPGGHWLVGLLGCAVLAAAAYQLYHHAWQKRFMRRLGLGSTSGDFVRTVERAGRAGYAARGIVLAIAGAFLIIAAVQHDPREAVGLSGVLRILAQQSWGQAILWFVAVGLLLYGGFCFAEARYRRAT